MKLVQLGKSNDVGNSEPAPIAVTDDSKEARAIELLRHRLISGEQFDSVEAKTALVGELVFRCYLELRKKRHL